MEMKIPKIIHYVWIGGKEKPKKIINCMNTWKKKYPEYCFKEWNENNFDISSNEYVKDAYKQKKWAFVSDYIRMYAIYKEGGIYFDTDVIAISSLDELLKNDCFVGFESNNMPFTAVFGAKKGHRLIKMILDNYNIIERNFDEKCTNTIIVSDILINNYSCKLGNKKQLLKDGILVLPKEILCEPSMKSKTIHAFSASWNNGIIPPLGRFKIWLRSKSTNKFKIAIYIIVNFLIFYPIKIVGAFIHKKKVKKNAQI